ncbi:pentapeptide repeat-containing protein [Streptomyces sp. NPDC059002]|uniref:pentapeptide repeat-containing protein n=1 Tax=Streptomyces sp. NPDC059002 TaxID=3346690 RepID=UPI0036A5034C
MSFSSGRRRRPHRTNRRVPRIRPQSAARRGRPQQAGVDPPPEVLDWARRIELISVLVASLVAVAGLWYSNVQARQTNSQARADRALAKEGQITDRYTAAVENLGAGKMDVRLGGIYALQRIMQDSPRDHVTIANVLATYIRVHAAAPPPRGQDVAADVQAAFTVLGNRNPARDGKEFLVDLHGAHLPGVTAGTMGLSRMNLWGADLYRANLRGAYLRGADLRRTNLGEANLRGADLAGAKLYGADLAEADLSRASLNEADLRRVYMGKADLSRADLAAADLRDAYLGEADLRRADLGEANLKGTNLLGARHVAQANLQNARTNGATALPSDRL